jgi:osmotically-inducible protein OsmY
MMAQTSTDRLLAQTIRRQLKADAATCDLLVRVSVRRGVVHCHACVANLADAENMEAVMQRIPGVRGLVEELDLA